MTWSGRKTATSLGYLLLIVSFSTMIVCYGAIFNSYLFEPELYLTHAYSKPFVMRVLPVWAMNFFYAQTGYDYITIFRYLDIGALSLSGWLFYKYVNSFFENEPLSKILALSIYFIIPFNMLMPRYLPLWYPYDSFGLLFLTAGLYFVRTHQLRLFYLVLFLGTFNRETTIILVGVFASVFWRVLPMRQMFSHLVVQISLWVGIKLFLGAYFADHSGQLFEPSLMNNVHFITQLQLYNLGLGDLERVFRYVFLFSNFGFTYLVIIFFWNKLDDLFLRRVTFSAIPFFVSIVFVGNLFEFRLFGELIPFVLMPAIYILTKMIAGYKANS